MGARRGGRGCRRRQATGAVITALVLALAISTRHPSAQQPARTPIFRGGTSVVSVDVVVRDGAGEIVRGLTAADFTVSEDGQPQQIQTFSFQEIDPAAPLAAVAPTLLAGVEERLLEELQRTPGASAPVPDAPAATGGVTGRRLLVLLFDLSSLQPEDVQRAVDSANSYVNEQMDAADLVSVVTIGSTLDVLSDFTSSREVIQAALGQLAYTDGTATALPGASTAEIDEAAAAADAETAADDTGFDTFNNDVRLRALKTIADTLGAIEQKKAILYFSAGMQRNGDDNQVELRAAINAAVRAHVAIYPVDSRGLQAVVPGGDASRRSGSGTSLFSGRAVEQQFSALASSQDTLTTLAADTGGRAFTDSNDFGEAFTRAQRDLSSYYLIGYSSANRAADGRFRRIQVRVSRRGARVESRAGYYADRDFANTSNRDRNAQLDDELAAAVSSTDLPVVVGTGWFRQTADRFYVPIALAVPGSAVAVNSGAKTVTLDVRGAVRDEQGRSVGRIRDTLEVPAGSGPTLAGKQVLYQSGVTLPPGQFSVKVVVRENTSGTIGSFEAALVVPQLRDVAVEGELGGDEHAAAAHCARRRRQPARARRRAAAAQPDARGGTRSTAVLLLRGLRPGPRRARRRTCGPAWRSTAVTSRSSRRHSWSDRLWTSRHAAPSSSSSRCRPGSSRRAPIRRRSTSSTPWPGAWRFLGSPSSSAIANRHAHTWNALTTSPCSSSKTSRTSGNWCACTCVSRTSPASRPTTAPRGWNWPGRSTSTSSSST